MSYFPWESLFKIALCNLCDKFPEWALIRELIEGKLS
jgi:hypothetical protein